MVNYAICSAKNTFDRLAPTLIVLYFLVRTIRTSRFLRPVKIHIYRYRDLAKYKIGNKKRYSNHKELIKLSSINLVLNNDILPKTKVKQIR